VSVFRTDVPETAYRFHIDRPDANSSDGYDLSVVWYRGVDNVLWCIRRGISIVCQCNTHSAVEPLVRAWFLGDCIPGIVADFIEERGEGEPWLLGLLRDDPDWYAPVPMERMVQGGVTTVPTPSGNELQEMIDRLMEMRRQNVERSIGPIAVPLKEWKYPMPPMTPWPSQRHRWINPQDITDSGPVSISGTTE